MRESGIVIQCRSKVCSGATIMPCSAAGGDNSNNEGSSSISSRRKVDVDCCGLSKLVTKLINSKESGIRLRIGIGISTLLMRRSRKTRSGRQSSFKCRYDPSSYSLNFDSSSSTSNSLSSEDDYYYQFCAFSSRFASAAAAPKTANISPSFSPQI